MEVICMTSEAQNRPASSRQIGYIRQLQERLGETSAGVPENLNSLEASQMIGELLAKQPAEAFTDAAEYRKVRLNQARLGLAMKECFRLYLRNGSDPWERSRKSFIKTVAATYHLFGEIEDRLKGVPAPEEPRG
jgi:hypothetical protein